MAIGELINKRVTWLSAKGERKGTLTRVCQQYPAQFCWVMGDDGHEYYVMHKMITGAA